MTKSITLVAAVARLVLSAAKLGGDVSIDDAVKLYGEAVKLLDFANGKLDAAKLKVEKLAAPKETEDEPV